MNWQAIVGAKNDEIAALKAERDSLLFELKAKTYELEHADEYIQSFYNACLNENKQLRAALAKIMEDADNPHLVRTLARRALEGK
jgi:hypothetical protein